LLGKNGAGSEGSFDLAMFGLPNLNEWNHVPTSGQTTRYNCVAWSIGNDTVNLWPDDDNGWPVGFRRDETIEAFLEFFGHLGYQECDNGNPEGGYSKIAIYTDATGTPTHVARLQGNGRWTSKMNIFADIEHSQLSVLEGGQYGQVTRFMKRALTGQRPSLPPLHPAAPLIILP
jgi:hypothetical protein